MNVNDTEVIFSILEGAGYSRTEKMEEADLVMANTCSIRDNAEQRIWGRIEVFHQLRPAPASLWASWAAWPKDSKTNSWIPIR